MFNDQGKRSSRNNPFTKKIVSWIRCKHRIPPVQLKRPDELTVEEVAARFGVSRGVVYYWINRNVLPARKLEPGRPYWITMTEEKTDELRDWVRSSQRLPHACQENRESA